jgi:hypothetical protein
MARRAELRRRDDTRHPGWSYLASRGFSCAGAQWENGRWAAVVARAGDRFDLTVWRRHVAG